MMNTLRRAAFVVLAASLGASQAARADDDKSFSKHPGYVDFAALEKIGEEAKVEVNLKSPMLGLVSKFIDDDPELRNMMANLKLVRVRVYDLTPAIEKAFMSAGSETTAKLDKSGWERVVRVRERDERVDIYFKPSAKSDFIEGVLIIAVDDEAVFVNIVGEMRPEDVARISEHFNIDDIDIDEHGETRIKIDSKKKTPASKIAN